MKINELPSLKRAALLIALDNGMIHWRYTSDQFIKKLEEILLEEEESDVQALEIWLYNLNPTVFDIVVTGEHVIAEAICKSCPKDKHGRPLSNILNAIFIKS